MRCSVSVRSGRSSSPGEQARVAQLLVDSVVVEPDGLEVCVRLNGLRSLITELNGAVAEEQERSAEA